MGIIDMVKNKWKEKQEMDKSFSVAYKEAKRKEILREAKEKATIETDAKLRRERERLNPPRREESYRRPGYRRPRRKPEYRERDYGGSVEDYLGIAPPENRRRKPRRGYGRFEL